MTKAAAPAVPDEISASCRVPLLVLFTSAALWLVIGSAFGLIASIKFHAPAFLAACPWLTYGRVHPAWLSSVLYGFCVQAGLGVTLWLFARLGRAPLAQSWLVILGAVTWNLGVTLGVLGILGGDSTGFETLEMPAYGALLVFIGYLLVGISATLTLHQRRERPLYVSQWYLLAALFWFPWIYSTADLLLLKFPVRGVAQAVIAWWFADNFLTVWLALVGLAAAFYFVPKLVQRELHNYYLALFTFWSLILFASWAGIPSTAPVPAWMPTVSTIATALTLLPILAVALNFHHTLENTYSKLASGQTLPFVAFGVCGFLVAGVMRIFGAFFDFHQQLHFSWFEPARQFLNFYGFFVMVMFGAIYYILPQLVGFNLPSPKLARLHFWLAGSGVLLLVLPLAVGGVFQATQLENPAIPVTDIAHLTLSFLRVSTLGDVLVLAGHLILLGNLIALTVRFYRSQAVTAYSEATADLFKTSEVKP